MARYVHAESNLYKHIRALQVFGVFLAIGLLIALFGWHSALKVQRVSLPPNLMYGTEVTLNAIHPWEVYSFAGYIWQQLNRCPTDCYQDFPKNIDRLTAFLTPALKAWLKKNTDQNSTELLGRTRFLLPIHTAEYLNSVVEEQPNRWIVIIDVELREDIGGIPVKNTRIRYFLQVIAMSIDPEFNPWGLVLDVMPRQPERIISEQFE